MHRRIAIRALALGGLTGLVSWRRPLLADDKGEQKDKQDDEKDTEIPLSDVPAAVRKAADTAVPKAKWETAYRDEEDGQVTYELDGQDAKGREVIVVLTSEGKVEEIETEIRLRDIPEVVMTALKAKYPRFKPSAAYELQIEGKVAGYDFEGKRPKDKHEIGIFVSADGQEIEIDEDA